MNRTDTESHIAPAKQDQWCRLCPEPIRAGENRLRYAQGKRSWLSVHVECAIASGRYDCKVLRDLTGAASSESESS